MKKILLSLVALFCATVSFAQNTLVATLTHGDEIKIFYGAFALRDAQNEATNGDVINLSGGSFQAVEITKALTIRGTGIDDAFPTYITGSFDINISEDVTERLSFEGCRISHTITVRGTLRNPYFLKSSIRNIEIDAYSVVNIDNCTLANCQLFDMHLRGNSTVQFLNSYIEDFQNYAEKTATASFINCVIINNEGYQSYSYFTRSSQLVNCILYWTNNNINGLPSTASAINCVAVGNDHAFQSLALKQNCSYAGKDIFKDSNAWNDLTDEAKEKYLGNDGTPIGMYGGILPYNTTPSYPQITKMNVASKTTADGKLSVEIEVSAAQ